MPELPEVETIRRGLAPLIEGNNLVDVELRREGLRYPFPNGFKERLVDRRLHSIGRRAKFLIFDFGDQGFLGHLGMSGSYRFIQDDAALLKHDHMVFHFQDETLVYHDPRRFGAVDLWSGDVGLHPWLVNLGPEPLGNQFSAKALQDRLGNRMRPIKNALLDQQIVAGLGNIYVCEALWQAKIHPQRPAKDLNWDECEKLVLEIRDVLTRAIHSGGSTLRDYRNADGNTGYFQHEFHVYGRAGETCENACGGVIERISQSGRSSFFCPNCQN